MDPCIDTKIVTRGSGVDTGRRVQVVVVGVGGGRTSRRKRRSMRRSTKWV
jgi:hypothetical protein